jgi:hypothetical protein
MSVSMFIDDITYDAVIPCRSFLTLCLPGACDKQKIGGCKQPETPH